MPFDGSSQVLLFRERRRKAAILWRTVPVEVFNMNSWECGTVACALGWLAVEKHDGWSFGSTTNRGRIPKAPYGGGNGYTGAARYFGLTIAQAKACFGGGRPTARFHGRWFARYITPEDVANALLKLPFVARQESS